MTSLPPWKPLEDWKPVKVDWEQFILSSASDKDRKSVRSFALFSLVSHALFLSLRAILIALAVAAMVGCASCVDESAPKDDPEWKLVWSEEFDDGELDDSNWSRIERGRPNWKDTKSLAPELLDIRDGVLYLYGVENEDRDQDPAPYLTAGIESRGKFAFLYGKIEVRARFKSAQGAWPAIWMMGVEGGHPHNGEIDLMEHLNFDEYVYQTLHSDYTLNHGGRNDPPSGTRVPIDRDDWNTYGCEWYEDEIIFTVNGEPTLTYPRLPEKGRKQWPFIQPFYIILSMQIGGSWVNSSGPTNPEHYPAYMAIDWVRVYSRK